MKVWYIITDEHAAFASISTGEKDEQVNYIRLKSLYIKDKIFT